MIENGMVIGEELNELSVDKEIEWGVLATPQDLKLSPQEEFVKSVLDNYSYEQEIMNEDWTISVVTHKADPESLLKQVIEDSNKIITQNAKGDIIPDYNARAKMKMELLKAAGVVKWKQPEVKLNFFNILFGKWNG